MFTVRSCLLSVALVSAVSGKADEKYKLIETISGPVRGVLKTTILKNVPYHSFKGIPYAKPPFGHLRFKAPEPIEPWTIVLDVFEHSRICVQPDNLFPEPFEQSEDCLTLNIYVPANVTVGEKLAVLAFIYGGGYVEGSSNDYLYGPDFIVEKQTILVTMNYRLGVLGFLSLDTPEYSGNMGLKDQQLALKWVHSNIGRFGGDNNRITLFGNSAGGASVHLHVLSTESRKYFRNAIPMSGVAYNYWAMSGSNDHLEFAYKIARDMGEPKNTFQDLVEFLKSIPAEKFNEYSLLTVHDILMEISFSPIIERKDANKPFIVESPEKIYETSEIDVDTMFTMTSLELVGYLSMFPNLTDLLPNFSMSLPFRGLEIPLGSHEYRNLMDEIQNFYFQDHLKSDQVVKQYIELLSDVNFGYGIDKAVRASATKAKGKTYYCWFSMYTNLSTFKPRSADVANIIGASHGDEVYYLFRSDMIQSLYDEIIKNKDDEQSKISIRAIENISKIITNFAKYGTPSHDGDPIEGVRPVENGNVHFFDINNDGVKTGLRPNQEAFDFWADIEQRAIRLSTDLQNKNEL